MPEGIIRDPKQNPVEKEFGILWIPDMGIHVKYYKKKNNPKRWLLAGTIVKVKEDDIVPLDAVQWIDGIPIYGKIVKEKNIEQLPDDIEKMKRMPLIHKFYKLLEGTDKTVEDIIDETIQEAQNNNIDYRSEVSD